MFLLKKYIGSNFHYNTFYVVKFVFYLFLYVIFNTFFSNSISKTSVGINNIEISKYINSPGINYEYCIHFLHFLVVCSNPVL